VIFQCLLVYFSSRRSLHIVKLSARAKETADSTAALALAEVGVYCVYTG
jgi:hypothetical protein